MASGISRLEEQHYITDVKRKLGDEDEYNRASNMFGRNSNILRESINQQDMNKHSQRVKGDYKPEIFFIG